MLRLRKHLKKTIYTVLLLALLTGVFHLCTRLQPAVKVHTLSSSSIKSTATSFDSFSIGIYNIAHGRGSGSELINETGESEQKRNERLIAINTLIAKKAPTFLILNECDFDTYWSHNTFQPEIIGKNLYQYTITQANCRARLWLRTWNFGNAILTNLQPTKTEFIQFSPLKKSELIAGNHDALLAYFTDESGKKIRLLAIHLEVRSEATRIKAVKQILEIQEQDDSPLFVAGDFNSVASSIDKSNMDQNKSAIDTLLTHTIKPFNSAVPLDQPHPTFPTKGPTRRLDWILIPPSYKTETFLINNSNLSDHGYVQATIKSH